MNADTLAAARAAIERDRAAGIEDGHSPVDAGEHDAAAGLLKGRCRICGEPWPCPASRLPLYLALAEAVAEWHDTHERARMSNDRPFPRLTDIGVARDAVLAALAALAEQEPTP